MSPVGFAGRAAWLEQQDLPGHRTATRVRLEGEDVLAEHAGNAWDLLACDGALWWARHGGSLWSTLFGKNIHRADLLRWDPDTGRARVIDVLEGGDDGTSVPRLFTDGEVIAWTSGQRVGVIEPATGARRWVEVGAEIEGDAEEAHHLRRAIAEHGGVCRRELAVPQDEGVVDLLDDGTARGLGGAQSSRIWPSRRQGRGAVSGSSWSG